MPFVILDSKRRCTVQSSQMDLVINLTCGFTADLFQRSFIKLPKYTGFLTNSSTTENFDCIIRFHTYLQNLGNVLSFIMYQGNLLRNVAANYTTLYEIITYKSKGFIFWLSHTSLWFSKL